MWFITCCLVAFIGSLKKKPLHDPNEPKDIETPASPTVANNPVDTLEQEFNSQLPTAIKEPSSSYGYSYTGRGFITQETFWFYSCVLMNCVNTVAIRLRDIKTIRLIRDPSVANIGTSSNLALAIDLASSSGTNDAQSPLIFTTLMDDIEVIAEKLKFAVSNAKSTEVRRTHKIAYGSRHGIDSHISHSLNHFKQPTMSSIVCRQSSIRARARVRSEPSSNRPLIQSAPHPISRATTHLPCPSTRSPLLVALFLIPMSHLCPADRVTLKRRRQRHLASTLLPCSLNLAH